MSDPSRAELIADATRKLTEAGVETPERDARVLMRWASQMDAAALTAAMADPMEPIEGARYDLAIGARACRMPVSHITRTREFWGRAFEVGPDVLDPRPETETLIALALEGPVPARILDLGTGSGCILGTLLAEWPEASGVGTDISMEALEVAARNLQGLALANRVELLRTNWLDGVEGPFDLVVSNPPYIAGHELGSLTPEVRNHEPLVALTAGGDGLSAYRRIAAGLDAALAAGGRVLFEIGPDQADAVSAILMNSGFADIATFPDLDGRDRVVSAYKPQKPVQESDNC